MSNELILTRSTAAPIDEVWKRLPDIATGHKFGVQASHDLKQKLNSKGVAFDRECRVLEVCNPVHAQKVLDQDIEISTALPCRIAVYVENGRTILATMKPTALLTMFNAPGATATAKEVEDTMVRIMEDACRG